jgi:hypothetical protein
MAVQRLYFKTTDCNTASRKIRCVWARNYFQLSTSHPWKKGSESPHLYSEEVDPNQTLVMSSHSFLANPLLVSPHRIPPQRFGRSRFARNKLGSAETPDRRTGSFPPHILNYKPFVAASVCKSVRRFQTARSSWEFITTDHGDAGYFAWTGPTLQPSM